MFCLHFNFNPAGVAAGPTRFTIISTVSGGLSRQFLLTKAKNLCSIVFHLLVPGGKCETCMVRPVSSAKFCRLVFQRLLRRPLLLPQSAVMYSLSAPGYLFMPVCELFLLCINRDDRVL